MPVSMKIEKGTAKNKKWKAIFSHVVDGESKKIKTAQFGDVRICRRVICHIIYCGGTRCHWIRILILIKKCLN